MNILLTGCAGPGYSVLQKIMNGVRLFGDLLIDIVIS